MTDITRKLFITLIIHKLKYFITDLKCFHRSLMNDKLCMSIVPDSTITLPNVKSKLYQSTRIADYIFYTPAIGKGSYSKVFLGHHVDNKSSPYLAIKRISITALQKMTLSRIKDEIKLLKSLNHPNIVKFHDAFTDIAKNIYIVTEYCNYGSFDRFIKKDHLTEEQTREYMQQLKDGLEYLISNNILHRDIKPPNILLHKEGDSIQVKIADFGFAKQYESLDENSMMQTLCGTPLYLAPEIVINRKYTILSDLWSIGVILYQLLFHELPFKRPANILDLAKNMRDMVIRFPNPVSDNAKLLLRRLLQLNPAERLTWNNFFYNEWFESIEGLTDSSHLNSVIDEVQNNDYINESISIPVNINSNDSNDNYAQVLHLINKKKEIPVLSIPKHYIDQQETKLYDSPIIVDDYYSPVLPSTSLPREIKFGKTYVNPVLSPLILPAPMISEIPKINIEKYGTKSKAIDIKGKISSPLTNSPVIKYLTNSFTSSINYVHNLINQK